MLGFRLEPNTAAILLFVSPLLQLSADDGNFERGIDSDANFRATQTQNVDRNVELRKVDRFVKFSC